MLSADGLVEPDLVSVRALRVAVGDDLQAAGAGGQGVDPLCEAFVLGASDGPEQVIILGHGALRVSARMFHEEVQNVEKQIRKLVQGEA